MVLITNISANQFLVWGEAGGVAVICEPDLGEQREERGPRVRPRQLCSSSCAGQLSDELIHTSRRVLESKRVTAEPDLAISVDTKTEPRPPVTRLRRGPRLITGPFTFFFFFL